MLFPQLCLIPQKSPTRSHRLLQNPNHQPINRQPFQWSGASPVQRFGCVKRSPGHPVEPSARAPAAASRGRAPDPPPHDGKNTPRNRWRWPVEVGAKVLFFRRQTATKGTWMPRGLRNPSNFRTDFCFQWCLLPEPVDKKYEWNHSWHDLQAWKV